MQKALSTSSLDAKKGKTMSRKTLLLRGGRTVTLPTSSTQKLAYTVKEARGRPTECWGHWDLALKSGLMLSTRLWVDVFVLAA